MSTTKITSEILKIESPIRDVYALLSDFSRIGRLVEMAKQMGMTNGLEMDKISEKIESTRFTEDACYITLKGMGELAVKIVEKEEPKLIKLGGDGATPFEFNLWIQLLENGPYDTRMKITFQGELNMVMKMIYVVRDYDLSAQKSLHALNHLTNNGSVCQNLSLVTNLDPK